MITPWGPAGRRRSTAGLLAAAVAAAALTACSSGSGRPAATSTAPLVQRFADAARNWRQYATGDGPGLDGFTDADLLEFGRSACASYRKTGSDDAWIDAHDSFLHPNDQNAVLLVNQAYGIVDAAHELLCP